jgi:hypothetical protein
LLCTKRKADKPNIIRQQIKHLQPGRHYSVTVYTGDHGNQHVWQVHQIGLLVRGDIVERPSQTIHTAWRHGTDKDFGNKDTYPNYNRIVFQAKGDTADLIISDWRHARIPTGPVGQELMFNFVQVEPYLMPMISTRLSASAYFKTNTPGTPTSASHRVTFTLPLTTMTSAICLRSQHREAT